MKLEGPLWRTLLACRVETLLDACLTNPPSVARSGEAARTIACATIRGVSVMYEA
jgi:hypothetical protein